MDPQRSIAYFLILLLLIDGFSSRTAARSSEGLFIRVHEPKHEGETTIKGHRNIFKEEVVMDTGRNPCIQVEPNRCSSSTPPSIRRMALVRKWRLPPPAPTSNQPTSYTKYPHFPPY